MEVDLDGRNKTEKRHTGMARQELHQWTGMASLQSCHKKNSRQWIQNLHGGTECADR